MSSAYSVVKRNEEDVFLRVLCNVARGQVSSLARSFHSLKALSSRRSCQEERKLSVVSFQQRKRSFQLSVPPTQLFDNSTASSLLAFHASLITVCRRWTLDIGLVLSYPSPITLHPLLLHHLGERPLVGTAFRPAPINHNEW